MDKNEISKEFITKLNNKDCAFYRGSNKIEVEKVLIQTINYEKGEYFQCQNNYNYKVNGKGEFTISDSTGVGQISRVEYYSTYIQVENGKVESIGRVEISLTLL